jgi:pimeloyl-ACP methyl ester carboxylesterase
MDKKKVVLPNNEEYYYLEIENDKPNLVLIHGNMSSSIHYLPLIERLKDKFHIYAMDLRGFGDSSYSTPIDTLEDFADDVNLFMDTLDIQKADIAGWSTGGAIALKFASKYSEKTNKIVLIESASYRGYPIFRKDENYQPIIGEYYHSKQEMANDMVQVLPMKIAFENKDANTVKAVWEAVIYTNHVPEKEIYDRNISETLKQRNLVDVDYALTTFNMSNFSNGMNNGDGTITKVVQPVLSIWGDQDKVVLEYMIDETVEALKDAKKVIIKESGHSPLTDKPDELAKLITNFLL